MGGSGMLCIFLILMTVQVIHFIMGNLNLKVCSGLPGMCMKYIGVYKVAEQITGIEIIIIQGSSIIRWKVSVYGVK